MSGECFFSLKKIFFIIFKYNINVICFHMTKVENGEKICRKKVVNTCDRACENMSRSLIFLEFLIRHLAECLDDFDLLRIVRTQVRPH